MKADCNPPSRSRERTIDTKLLIYGLFQTGRVLAQDGVPVVDEVSLAKEETIPHVSEKSSKTTCFIHSPSGVRRFVPPMHTQRVAISAMTNS